MWKDDQRFYSTEVRDPRPATHWTDVCAGCGQPWTIRVRTPGKIVLWCARCWEEVSAK